MLPQCGQSAAWAQKAEAQATPYSDESKILGVVPGNMGFHKPSRQFYAQQSFRSTVLGQRGTNIFLEWLYGQYALCHNYSALPL